MTSTARLTIVFLFVFAARAHGATVSLGPQPAMQVVAMEADGKGEDKTTDAFRELPKLESRTHHSTPVVILKQGETKYPPRMSEWGLQGTGEIEVTILADGSARDLKVIKSPHPAFEQAIVKAVLASEFKPGTKDEKAVSRRILIPFSFRFKESFGDPISDRDAPFSFPRNPGSGLPPELQYDVPPKIKVVAPVIYPREFLQNEITGHAKLAVVLNDKGLVRSVKVVDSSHPEFAAATKAMMQAWEFMPAIKDGKPIASVFVYVQKFHWDERDTGVNEVTRRLLKALRSSSSEIAEVDALDAPPKVRYQTQPVDPRPPATNVEPSEEVVVEFFIDPDGGVQLPRIASAKNLSLGWAAATAVKRWIFAVPTVKGEPVFVRRELKFVFK